MDTFPGGILSVVSDTWDLWKVITQHLPNLKEQILARDGKLVIRPDSGDPVDILCGYNSLDEYDLNEKKVNVIPNHPSYKGVIECLWDIFGGTTNGQGYKVLDSHIGAIYGDSITLDRANAIVKRLKKKGFASTNVVLGIGSFTYQFNTRDTFGFAMKATYVEINGKGKEIYKSPATDIGGTKKSAKGLLCVEETPDLGYVLHDQCDWKQEATGALKTIFHDGEFKNVITFDRIRDNLRERNTYSRQVIDV